MSKKRFFISSFISGFIIAATLVVCFEVRFAERIYDKFTYRNGFLAGQVNDMEYKKILDATCKNLQELRPLLSQSHNSRIERLIRKGPARRSLNHSHALLAKGIMASNPGIGTEPFKALESFADNVIKYFSNNNPKEQIVVDDYMAGVVLLWLYDKTGNDKYLQAVHGMAASLISQPRNSSGTLKYRVFLGDTMLVDDKGMVTGFLIQYGQRFNNKEAVDLGLNNLLLFSRLATDPSTGLPYHGYDFDLNRPFGPKTWLRGCGWLALGYADAILLLPKESHARTEIIQKFKLMISSLENERKPNGLWPWDIGNPFAPADTSGSAMIATSILLAAGSIDEIEQYNNLSRQVLVAVIKNTHANGEVTSALGECQGVGNYGILFGRSNYAQGPTLLLFSLNKKM